MAALVRPLLLPEVRRLKELPMALVQVALVGAVVGPLVGFVIGWLFLPAMASSQGPPFTLSQWVRFAAPAGMTYGLVFYSVFGLAFRYIRLRYRPSGKMLWLLGFAAWILALLLLAAFLPGGEWFGEAVRGPSIRILAATTSVF